MQRLMAVFVALAVLVTLPSRVDAVAGWSEYSSVAELTPTNQQRYILRLSPGKNPSGCKSSDTFYQDYSAIGADKMFMVLLQAVADDKKVRVFVTGGCELNGYAEISSVTIVP